MECAKCKHEYEYEEAKFCPQCGTPGKFLCECGKQHSVKFCPQCGKQPPELVDIYSRESMGGNPAQAPIQVVDVSRKKGSMVCSGCGSDNVNVQVVAEQKKRGCLMALVWIILAIFTLGAIIWIPLLISKGSKTRAYAVCQNCGRKWRT